MMTMGVNRVNNQLDDFNLQKINESESSINQTDPIIGHCLQNKDGSYRPRCISVSSQSTLMTTVSKADAMTLGSSINRLEHVNNNGNYRKDENKINSSPSTLSTIAEKLRRGTKKVLQFKTASSNNSTNDSMAENNMSNSALEQSLQIKSNPRQAKLQKGNSVDSAHTNTISNSSLQEVDAEEFDSAELAKNMGEINNEIR